jgi:hypothetical protein
MSRDMNVNGEEQILCVTQTHQMLLEDLLPVLRMVTRASTLPTLRESSLTGLSRDCPAKAVEAHAVAAAMMANLVGRDETIAVK